VLNIAIDAGIFIWGERRVLSHLPEGEASTVG
jgi:hypothetical protein